MKILQIHGFLNGPMISPRAGGKSWVAFELSRWLARSGHDVAILPWKEDLVQPCLFLLGKGHTASVFPTLRIPKPGQLPRFLGQAAGLRREGLSGWKEASHALALEGALREFQPDLIHVHYTGSSFPNVYRRLGSRTPCLLTHGHGVGNDLQDFHRIVFYSNFQREIVLARTAGSPAMTHYVHPAVPEEYRANRPPIAPAPYLVFIGSMNDDRKGLDLLLEAFRTRKELGRFRLEIFGFGALRPNYERLAREIGVDAAFHGYAETEDIVRSLAGASALVTPSREESFGVVYAQSACLGVPSVGFASAVTEIGTALGMPIGVPFHGAREDAEALGRAIAAATAKEFLGGSYREELSRKARSYFAIDRYGEAYQEEYGKISGSRVTA